MRKRNIRKIMLKDLKINPRLKNNPKEFQHALNVIKEAIMPIYVLKETLKEKLMNYCWNQMNSSKRK